MAQKYKEEVFPVHMTSILHGSLVGAHSLARKSLKKYLN
jgi:hypothetical protein